MFFELKKGSVLDCEDKYVAIFCNAYANQAGGLVHRMYKKYPYADIYTKRPDGFNPSGGDFPGNINISGNGVDKRFIINMITSYYPGSPINYDSMMDGKFARQKYLKGCLDKILTIRDIKSIAFQWKNNNNSTVDMSDVWDIYLGMLRKFSFDLSQKQPSARVIVYTIY